MVTTMIDGISGIRPRTVDQNPSNFDEMQGNEMITRWPEVAPGTALLDLRDGRLYEVYHAPIGKAEPNAYRRTETEERLVYKRNYEPFADSRNDDRPTNPEHQNEGFESGHLRFERFITTRSMDFPGVNEHGEVVVTAGRPTAAEVTRRTPDAFAQKVFGAEDDPNPVVLLDRTNTEDYAEMYPGDPTSYAIQGLYRPFADDGERVVPLDDADDHYPFLEDGLALDPETNQYVAWPQFGFVAFPKHLQAADAFALEPTSDGVRGTIAREQADIHLVGEWTGDYGEPVVGIESPFEKKEAIQALPFADPRDDDDYRTPYATCRSWDDDRQAWCVRKEALEATIAYFLFQGERVSVETRLLRTIGVEKRQWSDDATPVEPAGVDDAEPVAVDRDALDGADPLPHEYDRILAEDSYPDVDIVSPRADADLTLTGLDMALSERDNVSISTATAGADILPSVAQQWRPAEPSVDLTEADVLEDEAQVAWYHPQFGHRVVVTAVVGEFGPEYRIDVVHGDRRGDAHEHVATVAGDAQAAAVAMTHIEAMSGH